MDAWSFASNYKLIHPARGVYMNPIYTDTVRLLVAIAPAQGDLFG